MFREIARKPITIAEALVLKQRTFGSLCARRWVAYDAYAENFYATEEGETASQISIHRENNNGRFSKFAPKRAAWRAKRNE